MIIDSHFTFAENRTIGKGLAILKELAIEHEFFSEAIEQFKNADKEEKKYMCAYLLKIYKDSKEIGTSFYNAIVLSAYPE